MFLQDDVDGIEKAVEVTLGNERRADVGHDEIADEEHTQIGQMDEYGVVRLAATNRNQFDTGPAYFQLGVAIDGYVGLEIAHVVAVEAFAEEIFRECVRGIDFAGNLFVIVAPGVEARLGSQAAKIGLAA